MLEAVLIKVKGLSSGTDKTATFKVVVSFCCPCLNTDVEELGKATGPCRFLRRLTSCS